MVEYIKSITSQRINYLKSKGIPYFVDNEITMDYCEDDVIRIANIIATYTEHYFIDALLLTESIDDAKRIIDEHIKTNTLCADDAAPDHDVQSSFFVKAEQHLFQLALVSKKEDFLKANHISIHEVTSENQSLMKKWQWINIDGKIGLYQANSRIECINHAVRDEFYRETASN